MMMRRRKKGLLGRAPEASRPPAWPSAAPLEVDRTWLTTRKGAAGDPHFTIGVPHFLAMGGGLTSPPLALVLVPERLPGRARAGGLPSHGRSCSGVQARL